MNLRIVLVLALLWTATWVPAADLNNAAPTDAPSEPSPTATAQPSMPGPFPEDRKLPVNSKQQANTETKAQQLDQEIKRIDKSLKSKKLSPERREALERRRGELNAERMSIPTNTNSPSR